MIDRVTRLVALAKLILETVKVAKDLYDATSDEPEEEDPRHE